MIRGLLEFFDVPAAVSFDLPPEEAISFFRAKGLRPTFAWQDMLGEEHATSFTIAKMLDNDLLADVHESLAQALENGNPFGEWADTITQTLQAKGWWGREAVLDPLTGQTIVAELGSPSRLKTIFRTNLQTAYAAGAWQQVQEQADDAPFLLYDAVDDFRTRPEHAAWDGRVGRIDDPFWRDHYPPNGWNCRCSAIQLSEDDLAELGLQESPLYRGGYYEWQNPRTGDFEYIPNGLDPGFNYNSGAARAEELAKLAIEKAKAMPQAIQSAALEGLAKAEAQQPPPDPYPIPEYAPQKTVAAAERLAEQIVKQQGPVQYTKMSNGEDAVRFGHPGTKFGAEVRAKKLYKAQFTGFDIDTANFVNEWTARAQAECDRLGIPRLRGVTTSIKRGNSGSMGDGVLSLSRTFVSVKPLPESAKSFKQRKVEAASEWKASDGNVGKRPSTSSGYFLDEREDVLSTLWHEFAHHIHQQMGVKSVREYIAPPIENALVQLIERARGNGALTFPTEYARENAKEYFAECFALYKLNKLDKVPEFMLEFIRKIESGVIPNA